MNKPIHPRRKRLKLASQRNNLKVSPLTRRRKVRSPIRSDISSETHTSDVVQNIIAKSPRKDAFPTPKLNYENSLNLRPIILNVKEKRRSNEFLECVATEHSPDIYIRGRKERSPSDAESLRTKYNCLKDFNEMQWLSKRGQDEKYRRHKRNNDYMELWFEFLDVDGDKSVSAEELEDPLVSLGLAKNRQEAEKLVSMYDQDGDMELDFNEFQKLLQGKRVTSKRVPLKDRMYRKKSLIASQRKNDKQNFRNTTEARIDAMFDKISNGSIRAANSLPLDMSISAYRRKLLMDANMSPRPEERRKGMYVLKGILESRKSAQKPQPKISGGGGKLQSSKTADKLVSKEMGVSMFRRLAHRVSSKPS